jgi:hypothetical protein
MPVVIKFIARQVRVIRVFLFVISYHINKNKHTNQGSPTIEPPVHFTWIVSYAYGFLAVHEIRLLHKLLQKFQNRSGNVYEGTIMNEAQILCPEKGRLFKTVFLRTQ